MKRHILLSAILLMSSLSLWAENEKIQLTWNRKGVTMNPKKVEGITLKSEGGYATVINQDTTQEYTFVLKGQSHDGGLTYKGHHRVTIELAGLELESQQGSPLSLKCGKRCTVKLKKGTENSLTDAPDTCHKAVIWCRGHLELTGAGSLTLNARGGHGISAKEYIRAKEKLGHLTILATGKGCKGIRTATDFTQLGGDIDITTSGDFLALDTMDHFGPGPGGPMQFDPTEMLNHMREDFPGLIPDSIDMEHFDFHAFMDSIFSHMPDSLRHDDRGGHMGGDHGHMGGPMGGHGGFGGPMGGHGEFQGGPDDFQGGPDMMGGPGEFEGGPDDFGGDPGMMGGGPMMKGRYIGTTKALKALGTIIVAGGTLSCKTSTQGAEGIEGKKGVTLSGGTVTVDAQDDAINSGGKIIFSGADVTAISRGNDAVDSNGWTDGAITISGGHVTVFSGIGPPEEGFDCDQSAIVVSGGTALSVGSGMGPWPSSPNEQSATQPTFLAQNLRIRQGDTISVENEAGEVLIQTVSPVTNTNDQSLITCPALQLGKTYIVKVNGSEVKRVTLTSNFVFSDNNF